MMKKGSKEWIRADRAHAWHPFTDQEEWESSDPLVIVRGEGCWLIDSEGRRYLDANSSIVPLTIVIYMFLNIYFVDICFR